MVSIYKNDEFNGDPLALFSDAHEIRRLDDTADGQQVFEIIQYSESTNPQDTTFNKPILRAEIVGNNISYTTKPNGEFDSQGFDITFESGTLSAITVNDYVGSTLGTLGEPRKVFAFDAGGLETASIEIFNKPSDQAIEVLEASVSINNGLTAAIEAYAEAENISYEEALQLATENPEDFAEWYEEYANQPDPETGPDDGKYYDDPSETQYLRGVGQNDTFIIDGESSDYGWGTTQDGEGIVVWRNDGQDHDILYGFENIEFKDKSLTIENGNTIKQDPLKVYDNPEETQYVQGSEEFDTFVIDGKAEEYDWEKTSDGGYVVWNKHTHTHDILYDIDRIELNDVRVDIAVHDAA